MKELIFLEPIFKQMVWGGNRMAEEYGYHVPGEGTGECWAVSAHANGDCEVIEGSLKGKKLSALWREQRELFGNLEGELFPLLIKIIDAGDDLSIQVHPNDKYANEKELGALGKTECWYILDCNTDATIVIGHNAKDKQELRQMIKAQRWDDLIRVCPVKKGDFFQIDPGTVHAIKKGTLILETQQNSDITYRLYDYGRLQNGKLRELHIDKSIDVIECPHREHRQEIKKDMLPSAVVEHLVVCDYYKVDKLTLQGTLSLSQDAPFRIVSVLEGSGSVDGRSVKKGDHFIIPFGYGTYECSGNMMLIVSEPADKIKDELEQR